MICANPGSIQMSPCSDIPGVWTLARAGDILPPQGLPPRRNPLRQALRKPPPLRLHLAMIAKLIRRSRTVEAW